MKLRGALIKVGAILGLVAAVMAAYLLWARPTQFRWGATDEEVGRAMPGDDLDPSPTFLATRAITILGTPEEIWPWLMQMGYNRAGFYGYDLIESIGSSSGSSSADRIVPEWQHFKPGDELPISAAGGLVFGPIEPNRYLIWVGKTGQHPGGFTWALYPLDATHTRLVSRIRWSHHWTQPAVLALDVFTEFTDSLAVRKILQGVQARVEARVEPASQATAEVALFVASWLVSVAAVIRVLLRPLTWRSWLLGLAGGLVWLGVWYAPLAGWVSVLLIAAVAWGLFGFWPLQRGARLPGRLHNAG